MKKLNNTHNFGIPINLLFYIAYFLIIASDIFDNISIFKNVLIIVDIVSVLLLSIVILVKRKIDIKMFVFLILVFISAIISDDRSLVKLPFLLMAFNGIEFNEFIKKDFIFRIILVCILFLFNGLGITDNGILEIRNGFVRNSFGLGHPNSFAFYLTIISLDYYYIESKKNNPNILRPFLFSLLMIFFIFLFVGSRTNILIISLFSILFLARNKITLKSSSFFSYAFGICMILSVILAYIYNPNNNVLSVLDNILSRRLYLSNYFLNNYNITLFGNKVITSKFYALDNAYINLFIRYGIVLSFYLIIMFKNASKKLIKNKEYVLVIVLAIFSIYGLSETPMYIPAKNPYILLLSFSWISNRKNLFNRRSYSNEQENT